MLMRVYERLYNPDGSRQTKKGLRKVNGIVQTVDEPQSAVWLMELTREEEDQLKDGKFAFESIRFDQTPTFPKQDLEAGEIRKKEIFAKLKSSAHPSRTKTLSERPNPS